MHFLNTLFECQIFKFLISEKKMYFFNFKVLCRERDELLALLDVKERGRYLRSRSISEDEAYSEYSSTEVSTVLFQIKIKKYDMQFCFCMYIIILQVVLLFDCNDIWKQ